MSVFSSTHTTSIHSCTSTSKTDDEGKRDVISDLHPEIDEGTGIGIDEKRKVFISSKDTELPWWGIWFNLVYLLFIQGNILTSWHQYFFFIMMLYGRVGDTRMVLCLSFFMNSYYVFCVCVCVCVWNIWYSKLQLMTLHCIYTMLEFLWDIWGGHKVISNDVLWIWS